MAYIYDLADTWNNAAVTFTGIKLNVTDSASAAGSLLMDLQVGGVSQFSVTKIGRLRFSAVSLATLGGGSNLAYGSSDSSTDTFAYFHPTSTAPNFRLRSGWEFGWSSNATNPVDNGPDLRLARDAANTLAQRNGVNAQAFNLYNTYTDASNYERIGIRWSGNDAIIGVQVAGTGTFRQLHHVGQTHRFLVGNSGTTFAWNIEQTGSLVAQTGVFVGLIEMTAPAAPAANGVRIYAEDNGAGKTRLMAVFATGAAVQIAIEP